MKRAYIIANVVKQIKTAALVYGVYEKTGYIFIIAYFL